MLQPQLSNGEPNQNGSKSLQQDANESVGIDIQQELNRLEEMVLGSPRIPLTRRTLVDEEKLLDQLDFIRLSLPEAFAEAAGILQQKQEILLEAEEYGQQIVDAAQAKRAQILDEGDILRQAQREAEQLRRQVQQECEAMMQETLAEIDRKHHAAQQELEEMRQTAIAQAQEIEDGADVYADSVLQNIEDNLEDMLRVIRNGRQQLHPDSLPASKKKGK
jgi:F0F1-type ATP synthase membrane subunit b/b'